MEKIIFLDIDGVLNCSKTFDDTKGFRSAYNVLMKYLYDNELLIKETLLEIENYKLSLLKEITDCTGAKIVITSSWRHYRRYLLIEEFLINYGLPIVGVTKKLNNRGEEINDYLIEHNVDNYIIIDDEVFPDFTEEQKYNLVRTNFYQDGLNEESVMNAINLLGLKKVK